MDCRKFLCLLSGKVVSGRSRCTETPRYVDHEGKNKSGLAMCDSSKDTCALQFLVNLEVC